MLRVTAWCAKENEGARHKAQGARRRQLSFSVTDEDGNRFVIIQSQPDGICELCGKKDELRPYGPNGENICSECGMKDEETTNKRINQYLYGEELDS
jgi:hypothetical protein